MPTDNDPNHRPDHRPDRIDPDQPSRIDPGLTVGGEPFDDVADRAGRELRRSAPGDGFDRVHRSHQRRRATTAVAGGAAAVMLVGGGFLLATRGDDGSTISDAPPVATSDSTVAPTDVVTPSSGTGQVPTTNEPASTETTAPASATTDPAVEETDPPVVSEPAVSDEVLPDPLAFASDGVERELVGRDLVVRSSPEQVIPLDLPEPEIWLYGVGPNGVAYLRADGNGLTRIVGVPTSGPNTGTVYELIPPYQHEGPWLGSMTLNGVVTADLFSDTIATYIDTDGQPIPQSFDPTFTWWLEYRAVDGDPSLQRIVAYDDATRTEFELPEFEPTREGQGIFAERPLPDGRITVPVLRSDGTAVVWALTPSTGVWTQHPAG
jgi:hypothetical protein